MATTKSDDTLSTMFISDINRSRQAAFETTMADFESVIFNDNVADALTGGPITVDEYRGLFDRFIPATVKHRTISIDRAAIKAGKIGVAFLTDEEADGYNIHPNSATSMLPEQHAALQVKSWDRVIRGLLRIEKNRNISVANTLDPHNTSGCGGLYRKLGQSLAITEAEAAYWPSSTRENFCFLRWLYPTVITTIKTGIQAEQGLLVLHEAGHVIQAMRPGSEIPADDLAAHGEAGAIFRELEAYFSEADASRALGITEGNLSLAIHDLIEESGLPVQGDYTQFDKYSTIEAAIDERCGDEEWHLAHGEPFELRYIPKLAKRRLEEIFLYDCSDDQEAVRSQTGHIFRVANRNVQDKVSG